jgi:hypothetical protein
VTASWVNRQHSLAFAILGCNLGCWRGGFFGRTLQIPVITTSRTHLNLNMIVNLSR